jgi:hypothetical protein
MIKYPSNIIMVIFCFKVCTSKYLCVVLRIYMRELGALTYTVFRDVLKLHLTDPLIAEALAL